MKKIVYSTKPFILPLISLLVYMSLAFYLKKTLPPNTDLYVESENLFRQYGYILIFIGAVVESALVINLIVPGASIIIAGAFFSSQGVISYPLFFLITLIGSLIGFTIDYFLGRGSGPKIMNSIGLTGQLQTAEQRLKKWKWIAFLFGYIHPDLGSLYAIAAGALKIDLKLFWFYSIISLIFWGAFWTLPIYFYGDLIKQYFQQYMIIGISMLLAVIFLPKIVSKLIIKYKNNKLGFSH